MEFVVEVLTECFSILRPRATTLMRQVHEAGECSIGVFTADDARARVAEARVMAENASMPLRVSLRPVAAAPFRAS
jgi:ATP-dependent Clp protease adapter protein ClpS